MTDKNELIQIETKSVLVAFSTGDGLDQVINDARSIVDAHEPDLKTDKGRKAIASLARKVSKLKVRLDDTGKDLVADWKSKSKAVDASRRHLRDELDKLRDHARQPLTDWENDEKERVASHVDAINNIHDCALLDIEGDPYSLEYLVNNLSKLNSISVDHNFEEYELEARKTKELTITKLEKLIADKKASIVKDEELEKLRTEIFLHDQRERDEKMKHDAAESARIETEQKAQQEIDKIEKEKQALIDKAKEDQEQAEREKQTAIQAQKDAEKAKGDAIKAAAAAEIKANEKAEQAAKDRKRQEQEALERREANKRHVGKIRREAKEALMKIVDEDTAKKIVLAIDAGDIPHIKIEY